MMNRKDPIYVAGHTGMVGSAIVRHLKNLGFDNLITKSSQELDLRNSSAVAEFMQANPPKFVFLAAAKVGGILANDTYPADFIYDNLMIQSNVIHHAHVVNVHKLLFLGSSCIYPKLAPQPIREDYLLTGALEPTNEPYAIAKIAGLKLCQSYARQFGNKFVSVMPTSLYGPGDNYDLKTSHVLPALLRKIHEAKQLQQPAVTLWGTGIPRREFMHVDDLASACCFIMQHHDDVGPVNIGTGEDIPIAALASMIKSIVGYTGEVQFDDTYPDGTPRKLLDVSKLSSLGWQSTIDLKSGIESTYQHMLRELELN